jgi:hypothetical protein
MQSTNARDKRADERRECRTVLALEDGRAGQTLRATACNYSKGGVFILTDQPLWPGMEFRIRTDAGPVTGVDSNGAAAVRWCKAIRAPGSAITYIAGLQFYSSNRSSRPASKFRVIPGGAGRNRNQPRATPRLPSPSRATRTAAQPGEGQGRPE